MSVVVVELSDDAAAGSPADPETLRLAVGRVFEAGVAVVDRHGGIVEGMLGDVVVAVFGVPVAHEDDAERAVRAAHELQRELASANTTGAPGRVRLAARIGVATGEIVVGDPGSSASTSGPPVAVATRLLRAASEGEVLLADSTRQLLSAGIVVESRPLADGPRARWRLAGVGPKGSGPAVSPEPTIVGRVDALRRLRHTLEVALEERRARLVVVVGDAGVGKSRLARAFIDEVRADLLVGTGSCPPDGEATTFWPLREIVTELAGGSPTGVAELVAGHPDAASIVEQVTGAIGLHDRTPSPRELFPAVRRLLETLAAKQPTLIVVDDAHWAEPTLLELLDYVADAARQPLLPVPGST